MVVVVVGLEHSRQKEEHIRRHRITKGQGGMSGRGEKSGVVED